MITKNTEVIIVNNERELKKLRKQYSSAFIFIPSGPGGKVIYPVEITIK